MTNEQWKTIERFPNYAISSLGSVRRLTTTTSTKAGHILKPALHYMWYYQHGLSDASGRTVTVRRNRLVCEAFHGPAPEGKPEAAHKDGDRTNDRADNLYWASKLDNAADKNRHGRTARGEVMSNAKLTEEAAREIRKRASAGEMYKVIAASYGVSTGLVGHVVHRRAWAHVQ